MHKELQALIAQAKRQTDQAIALLEDAVQIEESMRPPNGAADPVKPSHELLGEMLLQAGKAKEAAEVFETGLLRMPNRSRSLMGAVPGARRGRRQAEVGRTPRHVEQLLERAGDYFADDGCAIIASTRLSRRGSIHCGRPAAALAIQEPSALFDPFELKTTATKTDDGFKLSGEKSLVARGADSELFDRRRDARRPPRTFHRRGEDEGRPRRGAARDGTSRRRDGESQAQRRRAPGRSPLGEGSPDVYADCIRLGRIAWSALAVGTAQAVVDYVIPYVNERIAFGEPISHRQAVAFKIADMATELEGMRLVMLRAASRVDQGLDYSRESALARRIVAQKGMQIGSDGVQLLGGHGYIKEHPVERWYRDLRAAGVIEGGLLLV